MLILITRTGGFAGRERTGYADTLCRPDGAALERLAERVLSTEAPSGTAPRARRLRLLPPHRRQGDRVTRSRSDR
ncbi:hypothetical protein Slala05_75120 [Streptomyces lavendulae subsp. lavendulae]|nr:hypothetical protein Slala05_75120 [Streptomyces lavendulae subsp. lavendulae]